MRRIALILALLAPLPAKAGCLVFCGDPQITDLTIAATRLAGDLGGPLPDGVDVTHMLEGGFQDRFILARLEPNDPGVAQFLKLLGLTDADLTPENDNGTAAEILDSAAANPDWWDWQTTTNLRIAQTHSASLPYLAVGIAAKPGVLDRYVIYLWGFET